MIRSGQANQNIERQSTLGSVDRIQPSFSNEQKTLALSAQPDPKSTLERNARDNMIRKRTGPAPSNLKIETTGVEAGNPTPENTNVAPTEPRFTRRKSRNYAFCVGGSDSAILTTDTSRKSKSKFRTLHGREKRASAYHQSARAPA